MALSGDMEDFSASQTVVWFDPPVPLLRGPVPSGLSDNPSVGPFVLAFRDDRSWRSAFHRTQSKCIQQCEEGARVGCSISASNKCSPPWWKTFFRVSPVDFAEREKCEEREMSSCLVAARESCIQFAKDKCIAPFRDARIAVTSSMYTGSLPKTATEVTNYRGSVLLDNDSGDNMQK
ncbi:hypothetical protein H6P81_004286 [Aristolochia fimbriata]|uniref:Uncharacterized protein n=1 Tax=Aristolochia fimbriata TaxID=158543 RepID=A0AAV7FFQ7_ARIFI|nr:hypothetical protein H6P81_004286 [Aristolochia fimbriata]